jgi:hypothetical protein
VPLHFLVETTLVFLDKKTSSFSQKFSNEKTMKLSHNFNLFYLEIFPQFSHKKFLFIQKQNLVYFI